MMPSLIQDFRYRPEIDGLRAIAVSVVVLYHAGLGVPGGFVGVDVFFVISGFLITSLIVKDLEAGTFTLAGFWERRIRRIIPALACVVLVTLLAGWFVLLPNDFAELGRSAVYLGLFSANIYFWRSSGYFDGAAEQKPLLHTWSLAVEEQFYLVFPLLLVGLFAIPLLRRRVGLLSLFGLGMLVSLGASAWGVILRPDATFYLLPTRAWELLLGAAVALIPVPASAGDGVFAGRIALTNNFRELLSSAALLGIILPSWHYTSDTPFPGIAALPPCLSTALFIWVTGVCPAESRVPLVARALSARPLVFVGLISYSLYLWHWPLIAFSNYASMKPPSAGERWLLVVASVLLAALSWRLVEQPFRTRRLCKSRRSIFAMGGLAMGCILCVGLATQSSQALPQRFTPEALAYAEGKSDSAFLDELEIEDIVAGRLTPIGASAPDRPVEWLVWGDSHAMAVTPAFDEYLKDRGIVGQAATHSWNAPLLGYFKGPQYGMGYNSLQFNEAVIEHIKRLAIANVVLVGSWSSYEQEAAEHLSNTFEASIVATVEAIREAGAQPWIMLQIPSQTFDVPKALAWSTMTGQPIEPLCTKPNPEEYSIVRVPGLVDKLRAAGANLLDPRPYCLSEDGTHYRVAAGGAALYRDAGHLSTRGAAVIVLPLLEDSLSVEKTHQP